MIQLTLPEEVTWVEQTIVKTHDNPPPESQWLYKIWIPDWLGEWDVFANWERERFASMSEHLGQGDVLLDIGSELGWQSVVYAQFVGPANVVLMEPADDVWPNIKATWECNFPGVPPLACYYGLLSDQTTSNFVLDRYLFPAEAEGPLVRSVSYRYIHDHGRRSPQMKIDDYCKLTGIEPAAMTMDTEGSELLILRGAEKTLKARNMKVWVSIHPELGVRDYGVVPQQVHDFMASCGYSGQHLATDHEEHWFFTKGAA